MTLKNNHPKLNNSKLIEPTNPTMIIKTVMQNSAIQSFLNQPTPHTLCSMSKLWVGKDHLDI
jgi:hypothetical protein